MTLNSKMLMGFLPCIMCVVFIFLIPSINIAGGREDFIKIKEVRDSDNGKVPENYHYGKHLYPNYRIEGLSDGFIIKNNADIVLSSKDILSIAISKMYKNREIDAYWVKIFFSPQGSEKMKKYTSERIDQKIALEISNTIFSIGTLIEPIENVVAMPITNMRLSEIKTILEPVSNNILIEE